MTALELIVDLHRNTERQGPGSPEATKRALSFIPFTSDQHLDIADLGCGTGGQTLTLAEELNTNTITAIDLFPAFLDSLQRRAKAKNLAHKIQSLVQSMDDLPFSENSLDLIWSEGAIYNLGFAEGIKQWKPYLKKGAYLAVSEITWITPTRPQEIALYWEKHYPQIDTAGNKIRILEEQGFSLSGYFFLPQEDWLAHYYSPLESRFQAFLERHNHSALAQEIVKENQAEINLYRKYKAYYSYGFYIAQKE